MKWRGLHGPIAAADAEAEPEAQRLFGPSYEARQRRYAGRRTEHEINRQVSRPWKKPTIEHRK
jgi:hypothetical protein